MKIDARNVKVSFSETAALTGATLWDILTGEVHGLVGRNGSGKTTFLRCVGGQLPASARTEGELLVDGISVLHFWNYSTAAANCIKVASQECPVVDRLSALENVVLGYESTKHRHFWARQADRDRVSQLMEDSGLHVSLESGGHTLGSRDRQKVALLRALLPLKRGGLLLLDEVTTNLSRDEQKSILRYIRNRVTNDHIGVLISSHYWRELLGVCDKISMFDNGRVRDTWPTNRIPHDVLQSLEHATEEIDVSHSPKGTQTIATLVLSNRNEPDSLSLMQDIHPGELIFLESLDGDALDAIFLQLAGIPTGGPWNAIISTAGRAEEFASNGVRRSQGLGFVSGDRVRYGVFPALSIYENLIVGVRRRLSPNEAAAQLAEIEIEKIRIHDAVDTLSGGYRQRLILLREWQDSPKLLVLRNPGQGLDANSRLRLFRDLEKFTKTGRAVLVLGSAPEITIRGSITI